MFGDKFYKRIRDLQPWQQTVYALALAERMYPNYALFVDSCRFGDSALFREALDELWHYLTEKGSRVDLGAILEAFEPHIPNPANFEAYGAYPALDACVALGSAYNAVICRVGEEAIEASHASVGCVAGFIEMCEDRNMADDELYEQPLMEEELAFQVELLKRVHQERDPAVILSIKDFAHQGGVSNVGISGSDD